MPTSSVVAHRLPLQHSVDSMVDSTFITSLLSARPHHPACRFLSQLTLKGSSSAESLLTFGRVSPYTLRQLKPKELMRKFSYMAVAVLALTFCVQAADEKNLLKPANKVDSWRLEQHEAAKGKLAAEGDAMVFEATEVTTEAWHLQASLTDLDLAEGKEYTLSFQAKADKDRQIGVQVMIDQDDWHAVGLTEQVDVTKEFKPHTFTFKAEGVVKNKNRVTVQVGQEKGKVWLKDVKLVAK